MLRVEASSHSSSPRPETKLPEKDESETWTSVFPHKGPFKQGSPLTSEPG